MRWHRLQWYLARISTKAAPQTGQQGILVSSDARGEVLGAGVESARLDATGELWDTGYRGFWFESGMFVIDLSDGILRGVFKLPFALKVSDYDIPTVAIRRQPGVILGLRKRMFSNCLPFDCSDFDGFKNIQPDRPIPRRERFEPALVGLGQAHHFLGFDPAFFSDRLGLLFQQQSQSHAIG